MRAVDELLVERASDYGVRSAKETQPAQRHGGPQSDASEEVLKMIILKHLRHWNCETLELEVPANPVYSSSLGLAQRTSTLGRPDRGFTVPERTRAYRGRQC